jgi:hypothetical protein
MRILVAVMVMVLGLSGQAKANLVDGNKLQKWCQGTGANDAACMGYVLGVTDMTDGKTFNSDCFEIPMGAKGRQISDIVKAWLEKNPGDRHYAAESLVVRALARTWPCKK